MTASSSVLKRIAGLPKLSQDELKALWREYFGVTPPAYRRGFLLLPSGRAAIPSTPGDGSSVTHQAGGDPPPGSGAFRLSQRSRAMRLGPTGPAVGG
jgi:hypothetical protein